MSELQEQLEAIKGQINKLEERALKTIEEAEYTDEHLEHTLSWLGRDRYVIIMPDGLAYHGVPGRRTWQVQFQQRPAALRAVRNMPGARVYDAREQRVIFDSRLDK